MAGDSPSGTRRETRRATIRTTHHAADLVAGALAPDDTESTAVTADGDTVVCRIERPTTGGLRSTVDDYVVNLRVATRIVERAGEHAGTSDGSPDDSRTDSAQSDDSRADSAQSDDSRTDSTASTTTQTNHTDTT